MKPPDSPARIYGDLFEVVQSRRVFADSKTFVDATPKSSIASIVAAFAAIDPDDSAAVRAFVREHFDLPESVPPARSGARLPPVRTRVDRLWDTLSRAADRVDTNSSLIPLPRPYIVPGGRFREIYYWDSYFTMLGLAEAGRFNAIEDMVENFAFLIGTLGFIPNGNRTYFCTRSQPPFFALMVRLLADVRDDPAAIRRYTSQLEKEYAFWMDGAQTLDADGDAVRRVVRAGDGLLNRYWDDGDGPRPESHAEDCRHAADSGRDAADFYRNIRAACESGWDFSSRWLGADGRIESIRTTQIVPVDLNALMYSLEACLADCHGGTDDRASDFYRRRAEARKKRIREMFFDDESGFFVDLELADFRPTRVRSLAAAFPLFLELASQDQADRVAAGIRREFLAPGGWLTTPVRTGQQWDRPNGWAPLQWIVYSGLCNYGHEAAAREGASRWVRNNLDSYAGTGLLFEKYDVERTALPASGGEYDVQDGFGWTNAVLLKLMNRLGIDAH